ncbi:DNA methyltransferase [Nocardioides dokdonensis]|nr:DNA methyltransferase [Nocardioides dokdonensis]
MLVAALGGRCVAIDSGDHGVDKPRRIAETLAAMEAGVPVIIGAQLPDDTVGGRTGSPDVLMRTTPDGTEAKYLPADIKHHTSLKPAKRVVARVSRLGAGFAVSDAPGWTPMTSHRAGDGMQLAHYTRMLQAMGRHPGTDMLLGAVLGTSDFAQVTGERYGFVWYDLSALTEKTPSKSSDTRWAKRSVLNVYDHQFAFRQKVAAAARAGETLVVPFGKDECAHCPYQDWCEDYAGEQDVSFAITVGRLSDREWRYLYDQKLGTTDALASADPTDPALLSGYLRVASHLPAPESRLATAVRRARMHRDDIALELTAPDGFEVPGADVEVDFDVEWHPDDGHVYQWGARVRYDSNEATATYDHTVMSFDILDDATAYDLAQDFFAWMEGFVADQEAQGRTVGIYHWTTPETRVATKVLGGERAERLFEGRFVDLKALMATHFFARDGFSLKKIAPLFDFTWRAPDAGGDVSVLKIEQARNAADPETAQAAREWLLAYNEDDCAAQAAIRDGLKMMLDQLPSDSETSDKSSVAAPSPDLPHTSNDAATTTPKTAIEPEVVRSRPSTQGEPVPPTEALTPAESQPAGPAVGRAATQPVGRDGRLLSLNEMRRRVAQFVIDYSGVTSERQNTGDFWKAFMRCYGVEDSYLHGVTFEYPAMRSDTGREGRIDVFLPRRYLIEQKTTGKIRTPRLGSESNAEQQAKAYLTGGSITTAQMPRYLVTSDFATIQVTDLDQPPRSVHRTRNIRFEDLNDHVEMFLFLAVDDPDAMIAEEQADASVKAARLMGDLYAAMTGDSDVDATEVHDAREEDAASMEASILLTRLLFLMFGDDAGLWERGLFHRFVETRTSVDGSDLGQQLRTLFEVLDTPEDRRPRRVDEAMKVFPYVNGDLYKDAGRDQTVWFDADMRDALLAACRFDWSRISPAVFGSLFQTVKSRAARNLAGEHYTSEENILKTLRPLFLDEYRKRLDAADTKPKLEALHAELKLFRYIDPACGCGNFLIVAYREMRALELELLVKLKAMRGREGELVLDPSELLNVRLDQFYGIELNWWPAKIAETAMYLVDHQANQKMLNTLGLPVTRLPINISAHIEHENALSIDWEVVLPTTPELRVYVFGNPPFLGRKVSSAAQKAELREAWGVTNPGHLDFVTAWHAKSLDYLSGKDGEFAFVTTNSITQGEPVGDLFPKIEQQGWRIKFAHRTFAWRTESSAKETAAVHCVIVGFTRDTQTKQRLFEYASPGSAPIERRTVSTGINGYLVDGPLVYATRRSTMLSPELPELGYGSMPNDGGGLMINPAEYAEVMADPVAAKYVRKFVGASELIHNKDRWCLWMVDLDPADVPRSPILQKRLAKVKAVRLASKNPDTWPHAETPARFWFINQRDVPYLCIPAHFSENRRYATVARFEPDVIAGNANFTCPDPDGFGFGIISSAMFMTWQQTVGGRLESRLRFSASLVWNNFPLPTVPTPLRRQIIAAGEKVLAARALHPDRPLADHYQPLAMTPELVAAHRALDKVVDKAFGVHGARRMAEGDRQRILFEKYAEMTTAPVT